MRRIIDPTYSCRFPFPDEEMDLCRRMRLDSASFDYSHRTAFIHLNGTVNWHNHGLAVYTLGDNRSCPIIDVLCL